MNNQNIAYEVVNAWDAKEIVNLYESAGWWKNSADAWDAIAPLIKGSFAFMVATDGEKTVGMGRAISDGASDAYIQDVVVLPEYQKLGIGKNIINSLTKYCVEKNIVWIGLIAEPGTLPFYEKLGFKAMHGFVPMRFPTKEIP